MSIAHRESNAEERASRPVGSAPQGGRGIEDLRSAAEIRGHTVHIFVDMNRK